MNLSQALKNSQGKIFYGMHFCPGVAQYDNPEGSFRVFVNEATIRKMNPTFQARPVFVDHVEEVDADINEVRNEADGWVVESFFNEADGKTWAKFLIVTDKGFSAIRNGYRLSNAYIPTLTNTVGEWNGVQYQKVVTDGEFEHLAIVKNPRYDESVIMTPDEFKAYNENLKVEQVRLRNSKDTKGVPKMKLNIFKRTKVENSKETDFDGLIVELPKSKKEIALTKVVEEYDKIVNMNGYANGDHMVKVNDKDEMSVNDLVKAYQEKCANEDGGEPGKDDDEINPGDVKENNIEVDIGGEGERDDNGDKSLDNDDEDDDSLDNDDEDDDADKKKKDKMKNDLAKKAQAKAKAKRLANANVNNARDTLENAKIDLAEDQIARGRSRYGSSN